MSKKTVFFNSWALVLIIFASIFAGCNANSTDLRNDFYTGVNNEWLKENKSLLESGERFYSTKESEDEIYAAYLNYFENCIPANDEEKLLFEIYNMANNFEERNKNGINGALKYINLVEDAKNLEELLKVDSIIYNETGFSTFVNFEKSSVFEEHTYTISVMEKISGIYNLPFYEFKNEFENLAELYGVNKNKTDNDYKKLYDFIREVIRIDGANTEGISSVYSTNVKRIFEGFDFDSIFTERNLWPAGTLNCNSVEVLKDTLDLIKETDFETVKFYIQLSLMYRFSPFLTEEISDNFFKFNSKLNETVYKSHEEETKKFIIRYMMKNNFPLMEKVYNKYFVPEECRNEVKELAENIRSNFLELLEGSDLYEDKYKNTIRHCVENLNFVVGLPDRDTSYYAFNFPEEKIYFDYVAAMTSSCNDYVNKSMLLENNNLLFTYYAYTVNCFSHIDNILILGGYLNKPNYDVSFLLEEKYGSLGIIIGHEIAHSFVNRLGFINHMSEAPKLVKNYNGYKELSGTECNGELVKYEAFSDLFGIKVALYSLLKEDENADLEKFFCKFASQNRMLISKTSEKYWTEIIKDGHPLGRARVNCAVNNFEEFYKTFGVGKQHKMYLKESSRVKVF